MTFVCCWLDVQAEQQRLFRESVEEWRNRRRGGGGGVGGGHSVRVRTGSSTDADDSSGGGGGGCGGGECAYENIQNFLSASPTKQCAVLPK